MIENIVDGRTSTYAAKGLDAFVEPVFPEHDNESASAGEDLPECARLRDTTVNEAIHWALSFGFPVTLYIYDAEVDRGTIIDAAHLFGRPAARREAPQDAAARSAAIVRADAMHVVDVYTLGGARLGCYSVDVDANAGVSENRRSGYRPGDLRRRCLAVRSQVPDRLRAQPPSRIEIGLIDQGCSSQPPHRAFGGVPAS